MNVDAGPKLLGGNRDHIQEEIAKTGNIFLGFKLKKAIVSCPKIRHLIFVEEISWLLTPVWKFWPVGYNGVFWQRWTQYKPHHFSRARLCDARVYVDLAFATKLQMHRERYLHILIFAEEKQAELQFFPENLTWICEWKHELQVPPMVTLSLVCLKGFRARSEMYSASSYVFLAVMCLKAGFLLSSQTLSFCQKPKALVACIELEIYLLHKRGIMNL